MSDSYHYEDGAIHNDHKKVLHIDRLEGANFQQLVRSFFSDGAEEASYEEVKPAEAAQPEQQPAASEPLNYFAPQKNLQVLLSKPWFKELRTKEAYDQAWTDAFVEALMASEWRDGIASQWAVTGQRSKVKQIKGYILGLLADACVLRGSYNQIAAKAGGTDDPRSFSRYMAEGKKQPYARWVKEYVIEH